MTYCAVVDDMPTTTTPTTTSTTMEGCSIRCLLLLLCSFIVAVPAHKYKQERGNLQATTQACAFFYQLRHTTGRMSNATKGDNIRQQTAKQPTPATMPQIIVFEIETTVCEQQLMKLLRNEILRGHHCHCHCKMWQKAAATHKQL